MNNLTTESSSTTSPMASLHQTTLHQTCSLTPPSSSSQSSMSNFTESTNVFRPSLNSNFIPVVSAPSIHTLKRTRRIISEPPLTPPLGSRPSSAVIYALSHTDDSFNTVDTASYMTSSSPTTPPSHQLPTPDNTPPKLRSRRDMLHRPSQVYRDVSFTSLPASFRTAPEYLSSDDTDEDGLTTVRDRTSHDNVSSLKSAVATKTSRVETERVGPSDMRASSYESVPVIKKETDQECQLGDLTQEWDHNLMRNVNIRRRDSKESYEFSTHQDVLHDFIDTPSKMSATPGASQILKDFSGQIAAISLKQTGSPPRATSSESTVTDLPDSHDLTRLSSVRKPRHVVAAMIVEGNSDPPRLLRHMRKSSKLRNPGHLNDGSQVSYYPPECAQIQRRLTRRQKSSDLRRHSLDATAPRKAVPETPQKPSDQYVTEDFLVFEGNPASLEQSERSIRVPLKGNLEKINLLDSPKIRSGPRRTVSHAIHPLEPFIGYASALVTPPIEEYPRTDSKIQLSILNAKKSDVHNHQDYLSNSENWAFVSQKAAALPYATTNSSQHDDVERIDKTQAMEFKQRLRRDGESRLKETSLVYSSPQQLSTTPFSQCSVLTAAELSEARVVSMSSHRNQSVMLLEHHGRSSSDSSVRNEDTTMNTILSLDKSCSDYTDGHVIDNARTGMRRQANLPLLTLIPASPASEVDRRLGIVISDEQEYESMPGFISSPRRALTSEHQTVLSAMQQPLSSQHYIDRGLNDVTKRPAILDAGVPLGQDSLADSSKLHPFWRPAHFWDDLDDDYEDANLCRYNSNENSRPSVRRGFSFKRTFAILPLKDDDHYSRGLDRRVMKRSQSGKLNMIRRNSSVESVESVRRRRPRQQAQGRTSSLLESWKAVSRRFSGRKRNERIYQLKNAIGTPIVLNNDKICLL